MTQRVCVIGLGSMGLGMARSLLRAGFTVTGCDISDGPMARLEEAGGAFASSPARAAEGADCVVAVVVNGAQTEDVLFGGEGCAATMAADAVFISSATMAPAVARDLAARLEATGRHYLDAPMSGGAAGRAAGAPGEPAERAAARRRARGRGRRRAGRTAPALHDAPGAVAGA